MKLRLSLVTLGVGSVPAARAPRNSEAVDALLRLALEAGATPTKPPQRALWGGYPGGCSDPDEHLLEAAFNPNVPLDRAGSLAVPP